MDELLVDFKLESQELIKQLIVLLENAEESFSERKSLDTYGQMVDRIMGGAKSLAVCLGESSLKELEVVGSYGEICKLVGYKGSQIEDNEEFYNIVVALLLDATEKMQEMVDGLGQDNVNIRDVLTSTFLERLRWVDGHFNENIRGTIDHSDAGDRMDQKSVDDLLGQLGVD